MTKTVDSKPVREARAVARKTARKGERSYQQALDDVARESGHAHWSAFVAANPGTDAQTSTVQVERGSRADTSGMVRAFLSGEIGQRNQMLLEREAVKQNDDLFSFWTFNRLLDAFMWSFMAGIWLPGPAAGFGTSVLIGSQLVGPVLAVAVILVLRWIARIVGDHPSMALRRAQLLLICNALAAICFVMCIISAVMLFRYPGDMVASPYFHGLTNLEGLGYGLFGAVFFRTVGKNGVRVMAAAAPGSVVVDKSIVAPPGSTMPNWMRGALEGTAWISALASASGLLLVAVDMGARLFGKDIRATMLEIVLTVGAGIVAWGTFNLMAHFDRLGYMQKGRTKETASV